MGCQHETVTVWTLEEIGQEYNRSAKEWGDRVGDTIIHKIVEITCAGCTQDLTEELSNEITL